MTLEGAELLVRDPRLLLNDIQRHGAFCRRSDRDRAHHGHGKRRNARPVSGAMRQPGRGTPSGALTIAVRGALFEIPHGFRSSADADLRFSRTSRRPLRPRGTATITDAAYRESLLTGGLAALFRPAGGRVPAASGARQPAVPSNLVLDIRVLANDSIVIDTSLARVATRDEPARCRTDLEHPADADMPTSRLAASCSSADTPTKSNRAIFDFRARDTSSRRSIWWLTRRLAATRSRCGWRAARGISRPR